MYSSVQNNTGQQRPDDDHLAPKRIKIAESSSSNSSSNSSSFPKQDRRNNTATLFSAAYKYEPLTTSTVTTHVLKDVVQKADSKDFMTKEVMNKNQLNAVPTTGNDSSLDKSKLPSLHVNNQSIVAVQVEVTVPDADNPDTVSTLALECAMPPPHIEYGYLISNSSKHKFVSKRINQNFYVKFPSEGIIRFDSLQKVGIFLTR